MDEVCYAEFPEGENGGLILNISETGLLMQSALKITDQVVARLRFRLPGSDQWIEARAKIAWVDHTGKEAGAQFLDLPEDCRARIAEWVSKVGFPEFSPAISSDRSDWQKATQQPPAANIIPATDRSRSSETRNREWLLHSFAQSTPASKPFWRRLVRDLFWVVVGIAAVLVALRYSAKVSMLARSLQVQSSEAGAVSNTPTGERLASVPIATERKGSTFGKMLTQTLSSVPAAVQLSANGLGSQPTAQLHAHFDNEPSQSSILVGAPAAGAPPVRLILGKEPVSASSSVAITETRSILVPGSRNPTQTLQLGRLVTHVSPAYPTGSLAKGIDGTVRVRAFIGLSGQVLQVQLLSGPETLASGTMNAIRQWRYGPTLLNGNAIQSQADVSVVFRPY